MILHAPFVITARLMPGLRVGDGWISLGYARRENTGRMRYQVWIDLPDGTEHEVTDLQSGCQGGDLQRGAGSLLAFLGAAAESYGYRMRTGRPGENEDLFPAPIVAWAYQHEDEIGMLQLEIEESATPLIEE